MNAVSKNCDLVIKHAHLRKTFKGVAELAMKEETKEEEKMDLS